MGRPKKKEKAKEVKLSKVNKRKSTLKYFSELEQSELLQIEYLMNKGVPYVEIVETIQTQMGKMKDRGSKYMVTRLVDYKRFVLRPKIVTSIQDVDVYKELFALNKKVDTLKEFCALVLTQKFRLERALELERVSGLNERFVRQEIKVMADILEKLAKLQMETGILPKAPRVLTGLLNQDENDPTKMNFQVTESFMKALDDIEGEIIRENPDIKELEVVHENKEKN